MKEDTNIRKTADCLSKSEIESFIDDKLSINEKAVLNLHVENCELCKEAIEGARLFPNNLEYSEGMEELKLRWHKGKQVSQKKKYQIHAFLAVAASLFILVAITYLLKSKQGNVRNIELAYSEDTGETINSIIEREGIIIRPSAENKIRDENFEEEIMRGKYNTNKESYEQMIPIAQLENAKVYSDLKSGVKNRANVNPVSEESKKSRIKYPFQVMSRPPTNLHLELPDEEEVADELFVVEDMPHFTDSRYPSFLSFIHARLIYPEEAIAQDLYGRVYVQFTVNQTGHISGVKVLKGVHKLLDDEVVRVVKHSPLWEPGRQRGRAVDVSLVVPVDFILIQ